MITKKQLFFKQLSWQTKLVLSSSAAIFLTFFLFSLLEYHTISKWMLNREEISINRTIADISAFYKEKSDLLSRNYIEGSGDFLREMNDKDQLIRVYDETGHLLISDKNGDFPVLEPVPVTKQTIEKLSLEGNEALVARFPISENHFNGTLEVVRQLNTYHKMMHNLFWVMTIFGMGAILLSALSGFFLAKQLLRPVRGLARTMKRIKENGFQERMESYEQKDELTELTDVFNEMMGEIETSFAKQKQFVEDASHELRTPVSILEGHLSLLKRWGKKDPVILEESLDASLQELTRLKRLINDLLNLTRAENHRISGVNRANIRKVLTMVTKNITILHPDFQFILEVDKELPDAAISEQHLEQVLIILIDNSIKYSTENKTISVIAKQIQSKINLIVSDKGMGIPQNEINNVFNRFYRIDKARSSEKGGTGLGLSIAKRIIMKNNGEISIDSKEGEGTAVRMYLPIVNEHRKF